MQVDDLKPLGLPVLQAQLVVHCKLLDSVRTLERTRKIAVSLTFSVINDQDEQIGKAFSFPTAGQIPPELQAFLHDYANRLVGERYTIEAAIQELQEEERLKKESPVKAYFFAEPPCNN